MDAIDTAMGKFWSKTGVDKKPVVRVCFYAEGMILIFSWFVVGEKVLMTAMVYAAQTAMAADPACASRMRMSMPFSMPAKMMAPAACSTLSTSGTGVTASVSLFSLLISVRTVLLTLSGALIRLISLVGLLALSGLTGLISLVGLLPETGVATPQGD